MNGEHHFNEVIFSDVFVPDTDVLGQIGDGWHQVTAELGFERSGPERILSTATLIFSVIRALGDVDDGTAADVGDLVARMISLRQLSISVARTLADGRDAAARLARRGVRVQVLEATDARLSASGLSSGASNRSSISRANPKSSTSGNVTPCIAASSVARSVTGCQPSNRFALAQSNRAYWPRAAQSR